MAGGPTKFIDRALRRVAVVGDDDRRAEVGARAADRVAGVGDDMA